MDARTLLIGLILFLFATAAQAGTDQQAADTLYLYYQADMDEDLDAMVALMDASFMESGEKEAYISDMRNMIAALFKAYDTKSFELTDADLFSSGSDAKIIYHLKSNLETPEGEFLEIDNDFVALLHDDGMGWKVTYVMPKSAYEERRLAMGYVGSEISDTLDYLVSEDETEKTPESEGGAGIFDFILDLIRAIIDFIAWLFEDEPPEGVVCEPPYIQVGSSCCLDQDQNNICDRDETKDTHAASTSTLSQATLASTTSTPTTTTSPTTTITKAEIACSVNSDCGEQREARICYKGDVYLKRITPICKHPGSTDAVCMQRESWVTGTINKAPTPTEVCGHGCEDGKCLNT